MLGDRMNCTEIRGLLSTYIDGETTPEEHRIVEEHLVHCQDCRRVLAEYRAIGGGMRALSVPVPPAGLRRDVWRAIEAQQNARGAFGAAPVGAGKFGTLDRPRERALAPTTSITTRKGWNIGRLLPAAGLAVAMLALFAVVLIANQRNVVQAATLMDKIPEYNAPVHVKFSKRVDGSYAITYTNVSRVVGDTTVPVTDVVKTYDNSALMLTIKPASTWDPGATYEVNIDAPRISTGVQGDFLAKEPVKASFTTAAYTATPTNTATKTATATLTPLPPTSTSAPLVIVQPPTQEAETPPVAGTTPRPTDTPRPPATSTPAPPTATAVPPSHTPEPTDTPLPTSTPVPSTATPPSSTATPTHKPSVSPTPRITSTLTPVPAKGTPTPRVTVSPTTTPLPCSVMPVNGFGNLWRESASVRSRLGCPSAEEWGIVNAAEQHFEGGYMFWNGDTHTVFVFLDGHPGTYYFFADTWTEDDPTPAPVGTPPQGLYEPVRGFGKIWHAYPGLRQSLRWATDQEAAVQAAWEPFTKGNMLWTGDRLIRVMDDEGTWTSHADTFLTPTPVANRPGE